MKSVQILYLYAREMNIYGDTGNVLTLSKRLEWRGYQPEVVYHHPGEKFDYKPDIVVGGGGQDSGQNKVFRDLLKIGDDLHRLANDGVPMLTICGLYQLFGKRFVTLDGSELPGIGIFNAETQGTEQRLIGPLVVDTAFGRVVGYENHSGQTTLLGDQSPFGTVVKGNGNNSSAKYEGAQYKNAYGCYLHGSVLPKNPDFADALLQAALTRKYGRPIELTKLDDRVAARARAVAAGR